MPNSLTTTTEPIQALTSCLISCIVQTALLVVLGITQLDSEKPRSPMVIQLVPSELSIQIEELPAVESVPCEFESATLEPADVVSPVDMAANAATEQLVRIDRLDPVDVRPTLLDRYATDLPGLFSRPPDDEFEVNRELDQRLHREGCKSGDVQITLIWDNVDDLDLHVTAPSGQVINYRTPISRCGGILDVDMNAGAEPLSIKPVENIFWPNGLAPRGYYSVAVQHFSNNSTTRGPTQFAVRVTLNGRHQQTIRGKVRPEKARSVLRFYN